MASFDRATPMSGPLIGSGLSLSIRLINILKLSLYSTEFLYNQASGSHLDLDMQNDAG